MQLILFAIPKIYQAYVWLHEHENILTAGSPKCVALEWSGLKASCKQIMLHEKSTA